MDKAIMVTVVCMTYNHEKYIRSALEGFVCQKTNFGFEVIVFDDASTDNNQAIIKEYEKKYPDIIKPLYQTINTYGCGKNRYYEHILPVAKGDYIAFCEGDDYWIDELKLQKQFDFMESHPDCSLVVHNAKTYFVKGDYYTNYNKLKAKPNVQLLSTEFVFLQNYQFPLNSMFFRRDYYNRYEKLLRQIPSYDYITKILLATCGNVYMMPDCMSVYRKGTDGSWTKRVGESVEGSIKHLEQSIQVLIIADEYTDKEYHSLFEKQIMMRTFEIEVKKKNKSIFCDRKLLSCFCQLPIRRKLSAIKRIYFN